MTLAGEVDLANVGGVAIDPRHEAGETARALVLDLRAVTYLDCAGVRLRCGLADRLHGRGRELVVVARPGSPLADVVRMVARDRGRRRRARGGRGAGAGGRTTGRGWWSARLGRNRDGHHRDRFHTA